MHTLCTDSEGNIHSVVDQKWHAILLGDLMKFAGRGNENTSIAGFVPVLHDGDT
jgi:hypothetical protein